MYGLGWWKNLVALAILFAVAGLMVAANGTAAELPRAVSVSETFDNNPFTYHIESPVRKPGYSVYRLTYPSPIVTDVEQNNTIPAEYYVPDGVEPGGPKRPAVICLHILEGDFELVRLTCSVLASHGIPAIFFKLPYYGERGLSEGPRALAADPELFVAALDQALDDVRRTIDLLASRPEVDPERIGITGISLGGITAATAAAIDPRLSRAVLILAGGDLKTIIHHARETRELSDLIHRLPPQERARVEQAIRAVDPLRHADRLRPRAKQGKVLMINAAEDEVIPPACSRQLASRLGISDQVIWLEGLGHYTAMAELPQILETAVAFFARDLPPGLKVDRPAARPRTPLQIVAKLIEQLAALLVSEPGEGRCHFADFNLTVTPTGAETIHGRVRYIRGRQGKFKLECQLLTVGDAAMGQSSYPWIASGGRVVFKGVGGPAAAPGNPLARADPQQILKLRMAAGAAGGIALAPGILNQWCSVLDDSPPEGPKTIRLVSTGRSPGSLRLVLRDDGATPRTVTFDIDGARGTLAVHGWQIDTVAHEAMFEPPGGLPVKEVDREDLYRVFASIFNFALESMQ